jgi:DDE superfamily endonuclease
MDADDFDDDKLLLRKLEEEERVVIAAATAVMDAGHAVMDYAQTYYDKTPYHDSALTGIAWVRELLNSHPKRIRKELRVHRHVFRALIAALLNAGHMSSKHVALEEQLAIFLYTCVTVLSLPHVGECFQRTSTTVSKYVYFHIFISIIADLIHYRYFRRMLIFFSLAPFYNNYVKLPSADAPIPPEILNNTKFYPFFKDTLGAIDGTHINCCPSAADRQSSRDRKGGVTQNCLAICGFDMRFYYVFSGWEGSASDSTMFHDARVTDLPVPSGRYYLADAGFPACASLLIPIRGRQYHPQEWGRAKLR